MESYQLQHALVFVIFEPRLFSIAVVFASDFRYIALNSMNASSRQYEEYGIDHDYYGDWQIEENRLGQSIVWRLEKKV